MPGSSNPSYFNSLIDDGVREPTEDAYGEQNSAEDNQEEYNSNSIDDETIKSAQPKSPTVAHVGRLKDKLAAIKFKAKGEGFTDLKDTISFHILATGNGNTLVLSAEWETGRLSTIRLNAILII